MMNFNEDVKKMIENDERSKLYNLVEFFVGLDTFDILKKYLNKDVFMAMLRYIGSDANKLLYKDITEAF